RCVGIVHSFKQHRQSYLYAIVPNKETEWKKLVVLNRMEASEWKKISPSGRKGRFRRPKLPVFWLFRCSLSNDGAH
ncbi:MAG: hypothetical protein KGR98_13660, partial [Verrucomicrobia bacterium]|nr:hypothetical protein [Verrucomicrobiota bacterium]